MVTQTLRFLLLISIATLMAGCKLAVIVVEGGEVKSDSSGTCMAGSICSVQVTDTNFQDAFEPAPNEGWYFDSWKSGDRFFCGGSNVPVCILSLHEHTENKAIGEIVASSETFYLMPVFKEVQPDLIVIDERSVKVEGREWLQPADFTNHSYNQVSEVCPDGLCSGTLPGSSKDLTGYMWASSDDVGLLFQAYRKVGRAILEDFENTTTDLSTLILYAMISDLPHEDPEYDRIYIAFSFANPPPDLTQEASGIDHFPIEPSYGGQGLFGAWFWRAVD